MKNKIKSDLVSKYLENISKDALVKYTKVIKKYISGHYGVYALYRKNKLYYVGLAYNLKNRLKHHLKDRHAQYWDSFSVYLTNTGEHLRELEALLLRIIDKKGNKQGGRFGNAEDLKKKLRNDFRKTQSIELENLFCRSNFLDNRKLRKKISHINKERGNKPVLADFINKRMHIKFSYKDKLYIAHVRRDGSIRFASDSADFKRLKGKVFRSPSLAAMEVTKRSTNGWNIWKYKEKSGGWVFLDELRKR